MNIEISSGEIYDKLSILEIKLCNITIPEKLREIEKEYRSIKNIIGILDNDCKNYYNLLLLINKSIWNLENELRLLSTPFEKKYGEISYIIHLNNDARFRIKSKINNLYNSKFKEQKSFTGSKKLIILPHLGMGDELIMIGAVRYYSLLYDEVYIIVVEKFAETVRSIYSDDKSIIPYIVKDCNEISPNFGTDLQKNREIFITMKQNGFDLLFCGMHNPRFNGDWDALSKVPFYKQFYIDVNLDYDIFRWRNAYMHREIEREIKLYDKVLGNKGKYIFTHDNFGFENTAISKKIPAIESELYVYHPNRNVSNDPDWICEASNILTDYGYIMEHAEEIFIMDSAFFALSAYLDLSNVKRKVLYSRDKNNDYALMTRDVWEIRYF